MNKIKVNVAALGNSESHPGNYILMLEEIEGGRRLPIVIGAFEAQAIAIGLEDVKPNRPLTHDLFKSTLDQLKFNVEEVSISALIEGIFYATIEGTDINGNQIKMDARSSDAIAMAIRFKCPIYTSEAVLDEAGITPGKKRKRLSAPKGDLETYSISELEEALQKALDKEDYEQAAKIRDLVEKKRNSDVE